MDAWREMPGQMLPDLLDRADEPIAGLTPADMVSQLVDDPPPGALRHLLMDRRIGQDLGEALGHGHEDQHARAARHGVQVLRQELLDRATMRALAS